MSRCFPKNSHGMNNMSDMNKEGNPDSRVKTGIYHAPWEKSFDKILTPFEEFIHRQTTSGLLLMGTAVLALVLANGPLVSVYEHLVHTLIGLNMGGWTLEMSLHHWINDGLMTLFFFVVGLELKREILVGELPNCAMPHCRSGRQLAVWWCRHSSILPSTRKAMPRVAGVSRWPLISPLRSAPWHYWRAESPRL